eukprot:13258641-Alexandrium_andersonii.AAC.1
MEILAGAWAQLRSIGRAGLLEYRTAELGWQCHLSFLLGGFGLHPGEGGRSRQVPLVPERVRRGLRAGDDRPA